MEATASFSKAQDNPDGNNTENIMSGYRLIDITIFKSLISSLACPDCLTVSLEMVEQLPKKKGFASYFSTVCSKCNYSINLYSSKTFSPNLSKKKVGMKSFEANLRMVYAMRSNGIGFSGLEIFCSVMNLPKPMTRCNYDKLSNLLRDAVKSVAETNMKNADQTIRAKINVNDDDIQVDTGVSVGGSWQRRGFASLNGVVTVISVENGKILDTETICKLCTACNAKEKLKEDDLAPYDLWKNNHECSVNYTGSAPNIEPVAAKRIFERSVEKYGLRNMDYYGDGDGDHKI